MYSFLQPLNKRVEKILNLSSHLQILMSLRFILPLFCMLFLFWWLQCMGLKGLCSLDLFFMATFSKLGSAPFFPPVQPSSFLFCSGCCSLLCPLVPRGSLERQNEIQLLKNTANIKSKFAPITVTCTYYSQIQ